MKTQNDNYMRILIFCVSITAMGAFAVDPRTNSWLIATSSQYVHLYTNSAAQAADVSITTWTMTSIGGTSVSGKQALPVYAGVQEIYSSPNWVYLRSSGMPASTLGPLLAYSPAPLILPTNQHALYRIPRTTAAPSTKTTTPGGAIGYMVDGSQMFDIRDALSWTGSSEGMGVGYWTRDAYVNEGYGFDPVGGHSSPSGAYHYHANPYALRYRLGDHLDYNSTSRTYSESTNAVTKHSPILGWVSDGNPVYGPYGYSNATNASSGVRRMLSGFVLRNGQNGTANLQSIGRTNIPPWAQRIYNVSSATGPNDFTTYPLGRYLEDHDFLGDLINPNTGLSYVKTADYDLDEYNGRFCVTPEFPNGAYAYFVTITTNGTPVFPYYIGRAYYGNPTGGSVNSISESVTTNFVGGPNSIASLAAPAVKNGLLTLTWSATEGGTYRVESTTNLISWTTNSTAVSASTSTTKYTNQFTETFRFFRVARTALASYDSVGSGGGTTGGGGGGATFPVPGGNVSRGNGTNITLNITLTAPPNLPPANAPIDSVTLGSLTGSNISYATQGTVLASFYVGSTNALNAQNVVVTFSPPPGQSQGPVYTFAGGFTINP
jgi:hypothetical protein